ncbi:MAG: 50S ribosomal protein L13 [Candidatus Latescibacteria bacterium]|nr:50S ribosomal protein L13 [Candidatus Latescibacterota bacterium]
MTERTYTPKAGDIQRKWLLVDAQDKILGRLASEIAQILKGKTKPTYTPHADVGDYVVVVNAEKIRVTGRKAEQKIYYRHTGYPGGLREMTYSRMLETKPEEILKKAVWGMLPHNVLGRTMFKKLKIYTGEKHRHQAQRPEKIEL